MDRLDDLLLEWDDRRRRGEPVGADDLCPDDPALRQKLAETITLIEAFESLIPTQATSPLRVPEWIGKYEIRRVLGIGGMGFVYEAWDPVLARTVAIKVLQPRPDPAAARRAADRFLREGQLLARFGRKSIVAAHEAGEQDGAPYLVMDYLPGGNLAARREQLTRAGPQTIIPFMEKVARAVQDAHDAGVLHRDLKPGNVLLDEKGNPFIADFGLAELLATDAKSAIGQPDADTLSGGGTPPYMAPEQWDERFGTIGKPTDVWALGVILYELLAGRKPFVPTAETTYYELITRFTPPPPPGVSKALVAVVTRCLEKPPAARFQSAGELADALRRLRQPTRRRVLQFSAAAALASAAGVGWWNWRKPDAEFDGYTDPKAMRETLKRLARGERVTLVERGHLPNHRFTLGPNSGKLFVQNGEVCAIARVLSVVELLPRLPPGEWAFEARIRHVQASHATGEVGIYAAHNRHGSQHLLATLSFTDPVGLAADKNSAGLANVSLWYLDTDPNSPQPNRSKVMSGRELTPGNVPITRGLRLEVRDTAIDAICDDQHVHRFGANVVDQYGQELRLTNPQAEVHFHPVGGLGLYIRQGELIVESAAVRPL